MTKWFIDRLAADWHGPAVDVVIGKRTQRLGDGVPEAVVHVKKPGVIARALVQPSLAFGEAYMNGDLVVEGSLLAVLAGFHASDSVKLPFAAWWITLQSRMGMSIGKGYSNAQHHYDIGNDFYQLWLDETRTYSCAYFATGRESLLQAQQAKLDLLCRKLRLQPGQTIIDIGAGWGGLVLHAIRHYGVHATAVTPAREQAAYITSKATELGLADKIEILNKDWREIDGTFDHVVSVGMFEHVGFPQYDAFLEKWSELQEPGGMSVLHTIGRRRPLYPDPWTTKYIFPGAYLPTLTNLNDTVTKAGLKTYRVENLQPHYAQTLACWAANFNAVRDQVVRMFDERFVRMWWLYLQSSEAGFRWGELELYQLELVHRNTALPLSRDLTPSSA